MYEGKILDGPRAGRYMSAPAARVQIPVTAGVRWIDIDGVSGPLDAVASVLVYVWDERANGWRLESRLLGHERE